MRRVTLLPSESWDIGGRPKRLPDRDCARLWSVVALVPGLRDAGDDRLPAFARFPLLALALLTERLCH